MSTPSPSEKPRVPPPGSPEEFAQLKMMSQLVGRFAQATVEEQNQALKLLEDYEFHAQLLKLLNWRLRQPRNTLQELLDDARWIMRTYYHGLNNFDGMLQTARMLISRLKLPFQEVRTQFAEDILGLENHQDQAHFFREVESAFESVDQRVLLLERLVVICEKKIFQPPNVLDEIYRKILSLDTYNIRSRKHFRQVDAFLGRWNEAAEHLEVLLEASQKPLEKERVALDLAQLYFYNIGNAERAKELLYKHCKSSYVDAAQVIIDCLEKLNQYRELVEYLLELDRMVPVREQRAQVRLKLCITYMKLGEHARAIKTFNETINYLPDVLFGHETLINALIDARLNDEIVAQMAAMQRFLALDSSRESVSQFLEKARQWRKAGLLHADVPNAPTPPAH